MKKISLQQYLRLRRVMRYSAMPEHHVTPERELTVAMLESAKNFGRWFLEPARVFRRRP